MIFFFSKFRAFIFLGFHLAYGYRFSLSFSISTASKLRHFSDIKLGISIPVRGESTSDLLNADEEKNDYEW